MFKIHATPPETRSRKAGIAALGLCSCGLLSGARAAPPHPRETLSLRPGAPSLFAAAAAGTVRLPRAPLDLRPPGLSSPGMMHEGTLPLARALPGTAVAPFDAGAALGGDDRYSRSALAAGAQIGTQERLAERIRREGLPVARLWESPSGLLSLGLNRRGKPGLWLIHKTH